MKMGDPAQIIQRSINEEGADLAALPTQIEQRDSQITFGHVAEVILPYLDAQVLLHLIPKGSNLPAEPVLSATPSSR